MSATRSHRLLGLVHVVRGEQDGHAVLGAQLGDQVPHRAAGDRVEADRRLVEDQQARAVHQRLRELQPPDHAAGVRRDQAVGVLEHAGRGQRPLDPLARARARGTSNSRANSVTFSRPVSAASAESCCGT